MSQRHLEDELDTQDGPEGRVVLFDVMGTLVHDPFHETMPSFFGMSFEELLAVKHPTSWLEYERGDRDEASFLADFFADSRDFDHAGLLKAVKGAYRLLPGMRRLLEDLDEAGLRVHLFSNYSDWYRYVEEETGLSDFARWTYVSCDHGPRKPEAEAFRLACGFAGVPLEGTVFIDDQPRNVEAAAELGLDAILFRNAADLRRELVDREIL
ncbi:MAG: HAD-IA family hydrolase [Planctomycetota bacterium]